MGDRARANVRISPESRTTRPRALILAVERDRHVRVLERYFLERAGYRVEFWDNGKEALEQVRLLHPNIVICEILTPELDGLSFCRALKEDPAVRDIVIIILSILAAEERAREAGADAFLRKPLNDTALMQTIEGLLAQRAPGKPDGSN